MYKYVYRQLSSRVLRLFFFFCLQTGPVIQMPVPSSYNDVTVDKKIRDHVGLVWYDKTFFVPESWKQQGNRVWLRFGSVHYAAQVVSETMLADFRETKINNK